jgi:hypothetical protein
MGKWKWIKIKKWMMIDLMQKCVSYGNINCDLLILIVMFNNVYLSILAKMHLDQKVFFHGIQSNKLCIDIRLAMKPRYVENSATLAKKVSSLSSFNLEESFLTCALSLLHQQMSDFKSALILSRQVVKLNQNHFFGPIYFFFFHTRPPIVNAQTDLSMSLKRLSTQTVYVFISNSICVIVHSL